MLVTAFLITVFIFLAGFYSGFLFDSYRIEDAGGVIEDTTLDTTSFVVERDFFSTFGIQDCDILNQRMQILGDRLGEIGRTLARYDAKKSSHQVLYDQLRRKYFLLEIGAYTLRKEMSNSCPENDSNVFLFFYNAENDQDSLNQGYVLDNIVKREKNTIIFSFDKDFNDTAVVSLINYYGIAKTPTLILNFDKKIEGYIPEEFLVQYLKKKA